MKEMSSHERMACLLSGRRPDRVPVMPFALGYTAKIAGYEIGDIYADPMKSFRAQILAQDLHGYDGFPIYGYASYGAWEFGGEIEFPYKEGATAPKVISRPMKKPEDVEKLEIPDPRSSGSIPNMLAFAQQVRKLGGPATFQCGSPFTFAASVVGEELILSWIIKEPDLVHKILRKVTDFLIQVAQCFTEEFGAENCLAFEGSPLEANSVISPQQLEKFALPYVMEIHEMILKMGVPRFFHHICGEHNKNIKYWKEVPEGNFGIVSVGAQIDLEVAKEAFGEKCIIAGNIDTVTLQLGTPEEIALLCQEIIRKGKDSPSGFILMPACELPPMTPPANLHAMIKAAKEYGAYT